MTQEELKQEIKKIMDQHKVGTLATVKDSKPNSRFMTFKHDEDFTFYTPTNKETYKTEEIESNPDVHILIGYEGGGLGDAYLEVEGQAKMVDDQKVKDWVWSEGMEKWFSGKEDTEYTVIEIMPENIRLMNIGDQTPQILEL